MFSWSHIRNRICHVFCPYRTPLRFANNIMGLIRRGAPAAQVLAIQQGAPALLPKERRVAVVFAGIRVGNLGMEAGGCKQENRQEIAAASHEHDAIAAMGAASKPRRGFGLSL